jgi:hypothetical protein
MSFRDKNRQRAFQREWLKEKRKSGWTDYGERKREWKAGRRKEWIEWMYGIKASLACIRCANAHPAIIDFHHRDQATKLFEIGWAVNALLPQEVILAEIEKCDALCSNCHRILHWDMNRAGTAPRRPRKPQ